MNGHRHEMVSSLTDIVMNRHHHELTLS